MYSCYLLILIFNKFEYTILEWKMEKPSSIEEKVKPVESASVST